MNTPVNELRGIIYSRFKSEADCARNLGWSKQKLNKITNGRQMPDITELNRMSVVLETDVGTLLKIFLA